MKVDAPTMGEGSVTTAPVVPQISMTTAGALAVADMIGVGVFTSLGFQVGDLPSGFTILSLWVVGGLTALCGALCYAELATALPRSGGEYNYLARTLHPAAGFLAGWVSAVVGFTAPVALAAMAFGQYFDGVFPGSPVLVLALGIVWLVGLVHLGGVRMSTRFQNTATGLKIAGIVAFIAAGFLSGGTADISFAPTPADPVLIASAPFAVSLVFVMYSYSGWNAATYIADEVEDPARTLPRALVLATVAVIVLYTLLNAVFLYTTPAKELAGQVDVALIAGKHIFGETGGRIAGALICFGIVSAIGAMTWIGPRVAMVMGEDNAFLSVFARKVKGVPRNALLFQLVLTSGMILTQSFAAVLEYTQFSLTLCSFLAVLGLMVLRVTEPGLPRPYRTWGYPITPLVFLAVTGYMMVYLVSARPLQSLAGLATVMSGLLVYWLAGPSRRSRQHLEPSRHA